MQNLPPHLVQQDQSHLQDMSQMNGKIPDTGQETQKILAHFDPNELADLDSLQGETIIDPETGLRDYSILLDKILKNPEVHEAISAGLSQEKKKFAMGGEVHEEGRPTDPELEELRIQGRHGDTELAIITPYILESFEGWAGKKTGINPHTGLPEFGGVGSVIKSVVRVVGTLFGPITGFVASKLTGQSTSAALKNAGIGATLATLPFIGSAIGGGGGIGGFFGGSGGMLSNIGSSIGNLFSPATGGGLVSPHAVVGANTVGSMLPASAFGQNLGNVGIQAAGRTGGGFLGNILGMGGGSGGGIMGGVGNMLPLIGSGLLMAKGHREEQRGLRDYQRALEEREQKEKAENESMMERMGFNAKLKPVEPYRRRQVVPNITREEFLRGVEPSYFENYAEGGAIRGYGKGQQDNIPKNIKENSYILDASTVSDIGDGSSNAGIRELNHFVDHFPSYKGRPEAKGGYIQAMVSNDEYAIPPEKVTAIGHGSNKRGSQILKKLVTEIRKQKRTSGNRLPPKAKPIGGYLKNMRHSTG